MDGEGLLSRTVRAMSRYRLYMVYAFISLVKMGMETVLKTNKMLVVRPVEEQASSGGDWTED